MYWDLQDILLLSIFLREDPCSTELLTYRVCDVQDSSYAVVAYEEVESVLEIKGKDAIDC
jgi:hypothetical protein